MIRIRLGVAAALIGMVAAAPRADQSGAPALLPTDHPKVPNDIARLWMAPDRSSPPSTTLVHLATAIELESNGELTRALTLLAEPALLRSPLGNYATYYSAEASLKLGRTADAKRAFQALEARAPVGYLAQAAAIGEAEADEAASDYAAAAAVYDKLLTDGFGPIDELSMRLAKAAKAAGNQAKAADAFAHVYFDFPLSELAPAAGTELAHMTPSEPLAPGSERFKKELARAQTVFAAKLYAPARAAFDALAPVATGDDRELIGLRLAECDYFLNRSRAARDEVRPYIERASRKAEALFFYGAASLDLNDRPQFVSTMRGVAAEFPSESWAEEALDSLANYYIKKADDDDQADALLLDLYTRYPKGAHAERAAWRVGWRAYRERRYADAVRIFEQAAHDFPRSDYRPPWLYWSGRAHEALGEQALAEERYKLELADYRNTYHGHLAIQRMKGYTPPARVILATNLQSPDSALAFPALPPNGLTIQNLLSVQLFDDAMNELKFAARTWGDTSPVEATIAWVQRQEGRTETGVKRFDDWRGSVNVMKRAYPQYLAAGGELLPRDLQVVIFPIAYWDTIRKYAGANDVDPYIVAALTAQESTFVADIKSYAGAVGLMQFMVPDAREWARKVGLPYSASLRANADASLKMGTAYLADLVRRFDNHMYLALAAYNAGPGRVHQWVDERPGMPQEEFIDDIPYPQTQNYVKKVLATAEDYRRLYGPDIERGGEPDLDAKILPVVSVVSKKPAPPAARPARSSKASTAKRPVAKKPASSKSSAGKKTAAKSIKSAKTPGPVSSSKTGAARSKTRAARSRK